ncbi:MAG: hypothetical protein ABI787_06450 [Spartobacteria bacterium]
MNRLVLLACVLAGNAILLTSCAIENDEDPFPTHSAASANSDTPVAGADAPPRGDPSGGWKW